MGTQRGLTLIELVVVLAILVVLAGAALPAFSGGPEASRSADARSALLDSLMLAQGRSALTGTRAVLCPSPDRAQCSDAPDWSAGWLVFLDLNANRELDPGEHVLRVQAPLAGKARLRSTSGRTRIVFQGNGSNAGSNVTFTLCDGRGAARARALILGNAGTLRDGAPTPDNLAATCVP